MIMTGLDNCITMYFISKILIEEHCSLISFLNYPTLKRYSENDGPKSDTIKGMCHKLSKNNFYLPHNFHFVCALRKFYYTRQTVEMVKRAYAVHGIYMIYKYNRLFIN